MRTELGRRRALQHPDSKMVVEILAAVIVIIQILVKLFVVLNIKKCKSKVSMVGKVIIVTGANSGIGFETAKDLAKRGGRVILGCRHEGRARAARDAIVQETGNTNVVYKHLDLASLESVRKFADDINKTEPRLDVLVNNAGVHEYGDYTADGIVEDMQINYFGTFLLTLLLLPLLKSTGAGRIVNVSSALHFLGRVNLEHINKKGYYVSSFRYCNSKLCMLLFTIELARRLQGSGVTVNAVHPGIIRTNLLAKTNLMLQLAFYVTCWVAFRSAKEGAQTMLHLAVAEECAEVNGKYFVDCKESFMTWKANNEKLRTDLWNYSEKIVRYESKH